MRNDDFLNFGQKNPSLEGGGRELKLTLNQVAGWVINDFIYCLSGLRTLYKELINLYNR